MLKRLRKANVLSGNRCMYAFLRVALPLISPLFTVDILWAQQFPTSTIDPGRIYKKFEKIPTPKSSFDTVIPEFKDPPPLLELEEVKFVLNGITVEGATVYKDNDFLPYYKINLGKENSLATIYQIAADLTAKYRNEGYLLSKAIVPAQRIRDGVVRIDVVEGFVDAVEIEGNVKKSHKRLQAFGEKIINSRPLHAKVLERYLLLINDLPGVSAQSVLTPSQQTPGAAKLTLVIGHKTAEGYASLDNRGSRFNGPIQASIEANLNSILGRHEQTGLSFVTTSPTSELLYFSGHHEHPLGREGTKITVSGNLSKTEPRDSLRPLNIEGDSSTISVTLLHPFIRSRAKNLSGRLGFYRRNSESDIFGGLMTSSRDRLSVFNLGVSYDFIDRYQGLSLVDLEFSQGANIFNARESGTPAAPLSRALGESDFSKFTLQLQRHQTIDSTWGVLAEAIGQYALDSLLSSEEFGFGGARFGRGYDSSEITGDHGFAVKVELQYSRRSDFKYLKNYQGYAFYDYGSTRQTGEKARSQPGLPRHQFLSSAGVGLRVTLKDWISGSLELAKPLDDQVAAEESNDFRFFARLIARY